MSFNSASTPISPRRSPSSIAPLVAELPAREVRVDPASYLGSYRSDAFGVRVTSSERASYLEFDRWPVRRYLAPEGSDRFVVGDFGMEITFTRDAQGRVTGVLWRSGQGQVTLRRVLTP